MCTEEQIVFALRQTETGTNICEVCRKIGVAEVTFCNWKRKYQGLAVTELRRQKLFKEENRQFKNLVADPNLDKQTLKYVIAISSKACQAGGQCF